MEWNEILCAFGIFGRRRRRLCFSFALVLFTSEQGDFIHLSIGIIIIINITTLYYNGISDKRWVTMENIYIYFHSEFNDILIHTCDTQRSGVCSGYDTSRQAENNTNNKKRTNIPNGSHWIKRGILFCSAIFPPFRPFSIPFIYFFVCSRRSRSCLIPQSKYKCKMSL